MTAPHKKNNQAKQERLEIVAQLYKQGYSQRQIQAEVKSRLGISYSTGRVCYDIKELLAEWREYRLKDIDDAVQLELERIDTTVQELWKQWEKSKEDYFRTTNVRRGAPKKQDGNKNDGSNIETYGVEEHKTNVVGLGNPSYIAEIRAQLVERRKLLGLYAPEKKDITTSGSFAHYLIASGMLDEAEQQAAEADEQQNGNKED